MRQNAWYPSYWQRIQIVITGKEWVHFMHIPKTGGTAVKEALHRQLLFRKYAAVLHSHAWNLSDLKQGHKVVFFIRDPVSRYVSAFNSALRCGKPRYFVPWTKEEEFAFSKFSSPSQLAEALYSSHADSQRDAIRAMTGIRHVRYFLSRWLVSPAYLRSITDQILFIGFQENLEQDFVKLRAILLLPEGIGLPANEFESHKTPPDMDTSLSDLAKRNLAQWYSDDYVLYHLCKKIYHERFQ